MWIMYVWLDILMLIFYTFFFITLYKESNMISVLRSTRESMDDEVD